MLSQRRCRSGYWRPAREHPIRPFEVLLVLEPAFIFLPWHDQRAPRTGNTVSRSAPRGSPRCQPGDTTPNFRPTAGARRIMIRMEIEKTRGGPDVEYLLDLFRQGARARPDESYWLARDSGVPVGVLAGGHQFSNWGLISDPHDPGEYASWIAEIFVEEPRRNEGIGSSLVSAFLDDAKRTPNRSVLVGPSEADDDYQRRVEFFSRHGFRWTTVADDYLPRKPWLMIHDLATDDRRRRAGG